MPEDDENARESGEGEDTTEAAPMSKATDMGWWIVDGTRSVPGEAGSNSSRELCDAEEEDWESSLCLSR